MAPTLIPRQFLFRFAHACRHRKRFGTKGMLVDLPRDCRAVFLGAMDNLPKFADVRFAWNSSGLAVQWQVRGKREPIYGEVDKPAASDGLTLWMDTRDTRTIHRATRYCQQFVIAAHDGQESGTPVIVQRKLHRALEDAPHADLSTVQLRRSAIDEDGVLQPAKAKTTRDYRMEVILPANVLHGFDPETNTRLGFCYRVRDREMGDQILAPGTEFPYWEDPSLWSVMELVGDAMQASADPSRSGYR